MLKNRIIYVLWLASVIILFLLVNNTGTLSILILSVVLPVLFSIFAKLCSYKIKTSLDIGGEFKKNDKINARFTVFNTGILPILNFSCDIECKNLLSGRSECITVSSGIAAKSKRNIDFNISSEYAGKIEVCVKNTCVSDLFKISHYKIKAPLSDKKIIKILPEIFKSEITLSDTPFSNDDSELYSMEKAGNDPSETFLIREYVSGDSIKNIHWKMSQKVDKMMVRELGLPIINNVLVLFDMLYSNSTSKPASKSIDILCDVFASVCTGLCESSINFTVMYKNSSDGNLETSEINTLQDSELITDRILSNTFKQSEITTAEAFSSEPSQRNYQHIILITANGDSNATALCNFNRVNVLLLSQNDKANAQPGDVYLTAFSENNYEHTLSILEI